MAERLIGAFRVLPAHPVFSSGGRAVGDGAEPFGWAARFVTDRTARLQLLTWARAKAGGPSFSSVCDEFAWTRSVAEDNRRDAVDAIVAGLNGCAQTT